MMQISVLRFATIAVVLAALSPCTHGQGLGRPMDAERRILLTKKEALALLPAEVVCEPMVGQLSFSDSGRFLLLTRQALKITAKSFSLAVAGGRPPTTETSLLLWDARSRQSRAIWKSTGESLGLVQLEWIPGTEVALALVNEQIAAPAQRVGQGQPRLVLQQSLLRITPGLDRPQVIARTAEPDYEYLSLHVSPVKPLAILERRNTSVVPGPPGTSQVRQSITLIGEDGRVGRTIPISPDFRFGMVWWDAGGAPIIAGSSVKPNGKPENLVRLLLDPKTGTTTVYDKTPPQPVERDRPLVVDESLGIRLKQGVVTAKEGQTAIPVGMLWVESTEPTEQPRVLVSADSPGGQLAPKADAILFQSQGALLAVPIMRIDRATLAAAREAAKRSQILNNAKQLGLAAHMYAADHDDTMPTGDDINTKLGPYLQNTSLFDGFSYTFAGGSLNSVDKPAETEMGFVTGPGGRAVIYVDGHVKWRADK